MKLKRGWRFLIVLFLCLLTTNVIEISGMNTGFSTEAMPEEKQTAFVSNISMLRLTQEPAKKGIQCFDVNEHGMIAVVQESTRGKDVCVYNTQGEFMYGYSFDCGQSIGVEWDYEHINVYFVRSDVIVAIDSDGNIVAVNKVHDTIDNNAHKNDLLYATSRIVDDTTYLIRNDMGVLNWIAPSFSQVVVMDGSGTENIIYDVNSAQLVQMIVIVCVVFAMVAYAVVCIIWSADKGKRTV